METLTLENDIRVSCIEATSFPHGVLDAHQSLHKLIPPGQNRRYFGISYPDKAGNLIYKAAAEELSKEESGRHHLPFFTIQKGDYLYRYNSLKV